MNTPQVPHTLRRARRRRSMLPARRTCTQARSRRSVLPTHLTSNPTRSLTQAPTTLALTGAPSTRAIRRAQSRAHTLTLIQAQSPPSTRRARRTRTRAPNQPSTLLTRLIRTRVRSLLSAHPSRCTRVPNPQVTHPNLRRVPSLQTRNPALRTRALVRPVARIIAATSSLDAGSVDFCEQMNGSCADFREYARSLDTMILENFYRTETSFFPSLWPILSYTTTDAFL